MTTLFPPKKTSFNILLPFVRVAALLLVLAAATPAKAHWPNTNATKWVQFPDPTPNGLDVLAAQPAAGALPIILADDFLCKKTGPITDIHIWASWLGDINNCNLPITLSIWSDVPAVTNGPSISPSNPGSKLWTQTFFPGDYLAEAWKTANELFWNPEPLPKGVILGPDYLIWQYNFYPTNPFVQQGSATAPVVYWLSMTAGANVQRFGWKTSTNHWNDDAVFGHVDIASGNFVGPWQELRDPKGNTANPRSLDLAFALTTTQIISNPPPATNKWLQLPDRGNGLDVNATVRNIVADDFLCKSAGTLTNIQIWGSWKDNNFDNNTVFVLSIWSDVPAGTGSAGPNTASHPGGLLWTETFVPGSYGVANDGTGNEQFYDPDTGQLASENQIFRYNFNPKKPFCQKGSTNSPVVYWLSISARPTTGHFMGWKTSTNHWNDDAVSGHLNAGGTALGDWKELHDPRLTSPVSLDLAFVINNGPPSADCDPHQNAKFIQWPDPSTNGLDVHATFPKTAGDDFLCRRPGPINGVTIWGSWLNDKVDPTATFRLSLWTDAPATPGNVNYSHPAQLLCSETFYPPTAIGTALQRYKYSLYASNLLERFYDPELGGPSGLIGSDTQIWKYDFYPRLSCWRQRGTPTAPKVYWITVSALTSNLDQFIFGWKTSTNHWNDDGVWGHMQDPNTALGDWKDLHHPLPPTNSLDLAFALRAFPIVGINKDLHNTLNQPATGVQIVVAGIHEITWHYDDSPPWATFTVNYVGGNTVLEWSGGKTVAPGAITHVGFEMGGTSINILSMSWLQGTTVIGKPVQVNFHTWNNGTTLTLDNNIAGTTVVAFGGTVEFFADPTPLDTMVPNGNRTPIASATLEFQPTQITPGCPLRISVPTAPEGARYAMFMFNLGDQQGQPATLDFLQLPHDTAIPPLVSSTEMVNGMLNLHWFSIPGRSYRLQTTPDLRSSFFDVFTEIDANSDETSMEIPMTDQQGYYRIVLVPE